MEIILVTEGTYPYYMGGVSVWCDQLIRGMPDNRFHVIGISVNGLEESVWETPPNVASITNLPLWGFDGTRPNPRRRNDTPPAWFDQIHRTFLRSLVRPVEAVSNQPLGTHNSFLNALHAMFRYSQTADLSAALLSNQSLERLIEVWHEAEMDEEMESPSAKPKPTLTLADALTFSDLMEHILRPLSHPPGARVDLVHAAMNGLSTLTGMVHKWTYGTPFVLSEHGIYLRERYLSYIYDPIPYSVKVLLLNFFRMLTIAAYQVADIIAPHSRYNRRWLLHNGAKPTQLRTMYNGVDPSEFPLAESEPEVPTLVFMGRIDPLKDLHTLIRSFALVQDRVPGAVLRIFGPVPVGNEVYYESCLALISQLGLDGTVRFEGRVKHPATAYHTGHVVVLSSISEGFPYTVIEAMACGRATVSTNVGGVAEGVGDTGIVVPPRDYQAIANACVELLNDRELRQRLGVAARARVLQKFTLQQSIEAYQQVYHEALGELITSEASLVEIEVEPQRAVEQQRVR